jgi:hypothetical protein
MTLCIPESSKYLNVLLSVVLLNVLMPSVLAPGIELACTFAFPVQKIYAKIFKILIEDVPILA